MTLVVTVKFCGAKVPADAGDPEVFVYELPLPTWWYTPASAEYLHHMAMGLLYEHDWCDNEIDYSWEVK